MKTKNISRRNFIRIGGMTGAALTIGYYLPASGKPPQYMTGDIADDLGIPLNAFISIDTNGRVTIRCQKAEMGQGAWTVVPQMIAEELEVDFNKVNILFAPSDPKKYGSQSTGGSSTVSDGYKFLLRTGAVGREMLITAAAQKWNAKNEDCVAENGTITHKPTGNKLSYGELVEAASKITPPQDVKLKERSQYKIVGKPIPRQDTQVKVNGKAIFGIDKKLDGMMYAVVERSPRILGKVKSFDDTETKKVVGVKHVFKVQRGVFDNLQEGVAVVADSFWAAQQGRKVLKVEWNDDGFEHLSTEEIYKRMNDDLKKDHLNDRSAGNFSSAYSSANKKIEAVYETPYESHSCMEPINCVASFHDNKLEVWAPVQAPDWNQQDLSQRLRMPVENITVNMTFLGGGFGRKAFTDFPHEAALISKEIKAPVKVIWTREDDMTQGPFRPGAVYGCKGGLSGDGRIVAFQTKACMQNMSEQGPHADKLSYNHDTMESLVKGYPDSIPNYSFGDVPTNSPIPVMWWRSVYSSTNGFAYESFMDELAHEAGKDPLDFRRNHLYNDRYQALIDKLEEVTKWKSRGKNEGWGVAITECFGSTVGEVVKVSKDANSKVKIDKVWVVFDCGWYVNPDIIAQQAEGAVTMAIGAATIHATTFADGMAVEKNFDKYKMPRMTDIPDIEVHIMENTEKPGGVGEPALPPLAPALCNAIFDLTGKRIRKLPFSLNEV